ncbi:Fip1 motif-domain-containing protein [Coniella lustricola]|uniref:Fip1 motif-domain-containing protein n=1 Tax=Coniella lustricola TaxID=2025994 RepID=A0A2T3ANE2_9PEZI|nr:Fip1 motif-domain-containing protein [Coniella lustricola]
MEIDDNDDDFYAPEEPTVSTTGAPAQTSAHAAAETAHTETKQDADEDLEEGEEEDEGGAMDEDDSSDDSMVIITERKDGTSAAPPSQSRYSSIKDIPQRSISNNTTSKAAPSKTEDTKPPSGVDHPAIRTSTLDLNAIPVHKETGKPITQVNIDEDLPENDKPWRKPGTDISDYFNYGFDEFTWALYASKQEQLRGEYNSDAIANNSKKMFEDMASMMMMGGMPGMGSMPGMPGAGAGGAGGVGGAGMPGMDGMPPEMQQMMQQMAAAGGMDPSQMDPAALSAMFAGMQNAGGHGQGGQGQNFGGGFGGNQGPGFGYDQGNMGGGSRGGFGGRGRGGRPRY